MVIASGPPELWTVSEKFFVAVCCGLPESITVTETVTVPAAVGVPVMTPVVGLIDRLAGNPVADHAYGPVPPVAETVCAYATPACALVSEGVAMDKVDVPPTVRVRVAVAVWDGVLESVTRKVRLRFDTVTEGVPLITPVDDPNVNPLGSVPEANDQVYGVWPPAAVKVCEYVTPT